MNVLIKPCFRVKTVKLLKAVVKSIILSKKEILRKYYDYKGILNGRNSIRLHFGDFCVFDPCGQVLVKSTNLRVGKENRSCL